MNRRDFHLAVAGSLLASTARSADVPQELRITRVVGFELTPRRAKVAGKNARLDVHGDRGRDRMLRLYTNMDIEGLGNCAASKDDSAKLLGTNPFDFYREGVPEMTGPLNGAKIFRHAEVCIGFPGSTEVARSWKMRGWNPQRRSTLLSTTTTLGETCSGG